MYQCSDVFLFRCANLPLEVRDMVASGDLESIYEYYKSNPLVQEAICLASPELDNALQKTTSSRQKKKATISLLKYLLRMSTRATPFGLFSSVGLGFFEKNTHLTLPLDERRKRVNLSFEAAFKFRNHHTSHIEHLRAMKVMLNPQLLYRKHRVYLYRNNGNDQKCDSIKNTPVFERIREIAKVPILYLQLENLLASFFLSTNRKTVENYLLGLFEKDYLICELDDLQRIEKSHIPTSLLSDISSYEQHGYSQLRHLQETFSGIRDCVKVDSYYTNPRFALTSKVKETIAQTITALVQISQADPFKEKKRKFLHFFIEKFGLERGCTLSELTQWIQPSLFEPDDSHTLNSFISAYHSLYSPKELDLEKVLESLRLSPKQLDRQLPSFDVFFELYASSQSEVDQGNFQICLKGINSFVGSTFGRFGYLWSEKALQQLSILAEHEADLFSPAVVVEIEPYLEQQHLANVAIGTKIRRFKLLLYYHEPDSSCLSLNDIVIRASSDRVFAYSLSLQKELCFVLGSAISANSLPLPIRFLLFLTSYQTASFSLLPDILFDRSFYTPRIRYRNVIVSLEKWFLDYEQLHLSERASIEEVRVCFEQAFNKYRIPDRFILSYRDCALRLERNAPHHFEIAVTEFMRYKKILISEDFAESNFIVVEDRNQKKYVSEFVVPVIPNVSSAIRSPTTPYSLSIDPSPAILPGNDWVYVKLYCPSHVAETFLLQQLFPVMKCLCSKYSILKWFYLYYNDVDFHFRIRIQASPETWKQGLMSELISYLGRLLEQEILQNFQICPYEREVERYGGTDCIIEAESVFYSDSLLCSKIKAWKGCPLPFPLIAAIDIIQYLRTFETDFSAMQSLLEVGSGQSQYLSGIRPYAKMAQKYVFCLFINDKIPLEPEIASLKSMLSEHMEALVVFSKRVNTQQAKGLLTNDKRHIVNSMIHMHCNRLLGLSREREMQARVFAQYILGKLTLRETYDLPTFVF